MKLVNMKMTDEEKAEMYPPASSDYKGPDYPYGLCLYLGDDQLEKLGIKSMPTAGDKVEVAAIGFIKMVGSNVESGGKQEKRLEIQLTDVGFRRIGAAEDESAATKLYDKK